MGLEHPEQVDAELVGDLGGTGSEHGDAVAGPGQHRQRDDLHAADGVGTQRAEREVRR